MGCRARQLESGQRFVVMIDSGRSSQMVIVVACWTCEGRVGLCTPLDFLVPCSALCSIACPVEVDGARTMDGYEAGVSWLIVLERTEPY